MKSQLKKKAVWSPADAAEFADLNIKTIYRSIREGSLPARRVGGRRYVILPDAFMAWLSTSSAAQGSDANHAANR